ncbi:LacI family DNA-binding transcriptional regulator [Kribbella sp. NPDC056861]|uniref:LacI family DNA-binding transcriptional regulator n=1 Tax=Kribbella sp. NPDC056861 TaxID=3154857 RepID=UPI0034385C24
MVTMTEVAHSAGVSVSTVSHVINGTRLVAPATREKVQRAMLLLGYQHRPIARSLSAGSNQTIGLALTAASNPYWVELVQGIDGEATRAGLNLIIVDTRDDARHESTAVANMLAHHIEGLVIAPSDGWRDLTLPLLRDHPVPYVIVDRIDPELRADQVGVENEASTAAVIDHLISAGHRRIGMVAGISGLSTSAERLRGYRLAHQHADLVIDPALIVDGASTSEGGRRATLALLELPVPPTAVFAGNNDMTIGVLGALKAAGIRVPRDMAFAAFDDFAWADLFSPGLTTVAQPSAAIGARAVQLLLRRMTDREAPPQTIRLPAEIMHRESCGCTPVSV